MDREGAGILRGPRNSGPETLTGPSSPPVGGMRVWRGPIRFRVDVEEVLLWGRGEAKKKKLSTDDR